MGVERLRHTVLGPDMRSDASECAGDPENALDGPLSGTGHVACGSTGSNIPLAPGVTAEYASVAVDGVEANSKLSSGPMLRWSACGAGASGAMYCMPMFGSNEGCTAPEGSVAESLNEFVQPG